jgi:formylglycine-generating enzyme
MHPHPHDGAASGPKPRHAGACRNSPWSLLFGLSLLPLGGCVPDVEPGSNLPSCAGVPLTCGPHGDETCCASPLVEGGEYDRLDPDLMKLYPTRVSDFRLDRFEVTVARFRRFVQAYPASKPAEGDGAHPSIAGSGWAAAWPLPASQADLIAALKCDPLYGTWADNEGAETDKKPINCVDWFTAFAFCAWDGGRLPTEAEWNYAAARGSEERYYPWGDEAPTVDRAVYCTDYSPMAQGCPAATQASIKNVGSKSPQGDGKWAQADLAGNVREWNLDWHGEYPEPCDNCAGLTEDPAIHAREARGGDWNNEASNLQSLFRVGYDPAGHYTWVGLRCARRP